MSKFGWSYPPGVTESMLPGNSQEDQQAEALAERIYNILEPLRYLIEESPEIEKVHEDVELEITKLVNEAYAKGYDQSKVDAAIEKDWRKAEENPQ